MTIDRTVVLVHGVPETDAIWEPLRTALTAREVDTIALSPPGFGAPLPDDFEPSMDAYADWLVGELETIVGDRGDVDVLGHDWGAGHVYGLLARRPDLVRTWAADVAGIVHRDYVWHDLAQAWQTPEIGEGVMAGMTSASEQERTDLFIGLGLPTEMAAAEAAGLTETMGRCILPLYRSAAQPAVGDLGGRLAATELPPGLVLDPTEDAYIASALSNDVARQLGADVLTMAGRGHWWMAADVDDIADQLVRFWSAH